MAVKRSLSAARMLKVFETVVRTQPAGVTAIAAALGADKSAVQRDLMTLADAEWIRPAPGNQGRWELTPHIMTLSQPPHSSDSLRRRARPAMERLRSETGETVYLAVPHAGHFVVIEALESPHILRMVPAIGMPIHVKGSATSRAVFAHMPQSAICEHFGADHAGLSREETEQTLRQGYAINDGDIVPGSVTMASAILGDEAIPLGAIVITGPADRFPPDRREALGRKLHDCVMSLSTGRATDAEAVFASEL